MGQDRSEGEEELEDEWGSKRKRISLTGLAKVKVFQIENLFASGEASNHGCGRTWVCMMMGKEMILAGLPCAMCEVLGLVLDVV